MPQEAQGEEKNVTVVVLNLFTRWGFVDNT
jgi:hypothetical protein